MVEAKGQGCRMEWLLDPMACITIKLVLMLIGGLLLGFSIGYTVGYEHGARAGSAVDEEEGRE